MKTVPLKSVMRQNQHRIVLVIDDSLEDTEIYRRYLEQDNKYSYTILEAETGEEGLELSQKKPDAILLDFMLPDFDGLELLVELKAKYYLKHLPIILLTGHGDETIAVKAIKGGAQDYLVKGRITSEGLRFAVDNAIKTAALQAKIEQQSQRERLILQITQQIRQSLQLDRILDTTVSEVRKFLQTDRVVIFRFNKDWSGAAISESVAPEYISILSQNIYDPCFGKNYVQHYKQGRIRIVSDLDSGKLNKCYVNMLTQFQVKANLVVPILLDEGLWGLLIVHHCSTKRKWQQIEVELLEQLATQVSIAIHQAELYNQLEQELNERKRKEAALLESEDNLRQINSRLLKITNQYKLQNQELDQFTYIVSHDLKAPLRAIANISTWIEEDLGQQVETETKKNLSMLRSRLNHMQSLINGLLDYSRVGRTQIAIETIPVADLLDEIINSLQPSSDFNIVISPQMPTLQGRKILLQQVFANLLSNAIKHHDRSDGKIEISVKDLETCYEFSISDDGPGIAPEYHNKVFAIFQTLESKYKSDSTGIGLAIVKKIVENEGGKITLESQLNQGTKFTFTWLK
ncbi:bacteriophytochrome (light-regulated signal transduction histidine kinase) [Rivularia sp. PCC 7116]|uniref:ATP-binding protein n=1 Tax=Rivularia sp. PCC 7116 TaxID=373994 RepID=UPI00029EF84A|nr:ATP-binding protein [Rivularia sp. PCC 7116]AFY53378.1 bacteriophytochrome (light-regulated signal transduction histidine kinase) [Rivularia sp. PCC 7116]